MSCRALGLLKMSFGLPAAVGAGVDVSAFPADEGTAFRCLNELNERSGAEGTVAGKPKGRFRADRPRPRS